MNYIGSKHTLLPFLETSIIGVAGCNQHRFCDLFAGTGAVGKHFKRLGYSIIANAKYIFLSYNNEGLMSLDDIMDIMSSRGKYGCIEKNICVLGRIK